MATPKPKVVSEVCSLCGLDWKRHGEKPTTETCVGLLLEEVRSLNAQLAHRPYLQPIPYVRPIPVYPRPYWAWGGGQTTAIGLHQNVMTSSTANIPSASAVTPLALKAVSGVVR